MGSEVEVTSWSFFKEEKRVLDRVLLLQAIFQLTIHKWLLWNWIHVKYFDKVTFKQLKDSARNVLKKIKSTSLSEIFSTELKFTIYLLVKWFNDVFKSRFNKLDELKRKIYKEKSY